MNYDQILAKIKNAYHDEEIRWLADQAAVDPSARSQLADAVSREPAALPPLVLLEVSRWGVNDHLSKCAEIRNRGES